MAYRSWNCWKLNGSWSCNIFLVTGNRIECNYRSYCYRESDWNNHLYCYRNKCSRMYRNSNRYNYGNP